jgi:hypothetical protein
MPRATRRRSRLLMKKLALKMRLLTASTKWRRRRNRRQTRRGKQRGGSALAAAAAPTNECNVFNLNSSAGFFSVFFFMCQTYLVAKKKGIPFFVQNQGWPFAIERGWNDYFTTLDTGSQQLCANPRYSAHLMTEPGHIFTVKEYVDTIQEIFKPNERINAIIRDMKAKLGPNYTAIMIRKGDKVQGPTKEMSDIPVADLLEQLKIQDDGRTVFLMTDDISVLGEVKAALPSCRVLTLSSEKETGFYLAQFHMRSAEERREHTDTMIASSMILIGGAPAWADTRSNTGRFLYLLSPSTVRLYPQPHPETVPAEQKIEPAYDLNPR